MYFHFSKSHRTRSDMGKDLDYLLSICNYWNWKTTSILKSDDDYVGRNGFLTVTKQDITTYPSYGFLRGFIDSGCKMLNQDENQDFNGADQEGFGVYACTLSVRHKKLQVFKIFRTEFEITQGLHSSAAFLSSGQIWQWWIGQLYTNSTSKTKKSLVCKSEIVIGCEKHSNPKRLKSTEKLFCVEERSKRQKFYRCLV